MLFFGNVGYEYHGDKKMKIKTKKFLLFLKKVMMIKSQMISECIFNFGVDGLKINASNEASLSKVTGLLKKASFIDYAELGRIGIGELPNLVKIIERFGEEITIKIEGNLLTISQSGKKVEIELMDEKFINTNEKEIVLEHTDSFVLEADKLHEILDDVKLNDESKIRLITEEGRLRIVNSGKYKFSHEFIATCKGGANVQFGQPIFHAVTELTDNLIFNIKTDYPIEIIEKTEDTEISLIIAPLVDND
jgi:hypothetical protein